MIGEIAPRDMLAMLAGCGIVPRLSFGGARTLVVQSTKVIQIIYHSLPTFQSPM